MRILQLSYERSPKRGAATGGDLGMFQNLSALKALGHEVHLAIIAPLDPVDAEVRTMVASAHEVEVPTPAPLRPFKRVLNPETYMLRFRDRTGHSDAIAKLARKLDVDLIWADSIFGLSYAPRAEYRTVFGHYDFLFKLKRVRRETASKFSLSELRDVRALRRRIRRPDAMSLAALERLEWQLAGEAAHIMCVSASESEFLKSRGLDSTHIPIVGPTIPMPSASASGPPRFFLFGNHNTAHASALSEIRRKLWPALERAGGVGEWHQIGRPPKHPDEDWQWMERSFHKVHGFVEDLSNVFRVGDVSIVPYRHDTGFRTKFTVAAGHGVISAGFHETFLCAPEFTRGVDCIAEGDVNELAIRLRRLVTDHAYRMSLGTASRTLYERTYTFESQLPRYEQILSLALHRRAA